MIRVAHFSDLHYAGTTLSEADRCFSFAVDAAIARGVDCAVISGDSTDHALEVHAPAVEALARNIRRLADHCPVLMLHGTFSHEPPGVLNVSACWAGASASTSPTGCSRWRSSRTAAGGNRRAGALSRSHQTRGRLFPAYRPSTRRWLQRQWCHRSGARRWASRTALLRGLAPINEAARAAGVPTIGVSHGTVYGCVTEHGVPMAGFDHEFTTGSLFGAGAQAFLLGHIHKHQSWEQDGRMIAYAGSIGRLHYGEQGAKGFLIWDVGAASVRFDLIATPAKRTVEISFDGMPNLEELQEIARNNDVSGTFVRVRWTMPEEDRHEVDRLAIQGIFGAAAEVKLEGRVIPVVRTRARASRRVEHRRQDRCLK
jgi:exonuclease SbcD